MLERAILLMAICLSVRPSVPSGRNMRITVNGESLFLAKLMQRIFNRDKIQDTSYAPDRPTEYVDTVSR